MTEAEWLNEKRRAHWMVWSLRDSKLARTKAGKRKLRLFACACCRLTWDLLNAPLLRQSVEVAERFADGQASKEELDRVYASARGMGVGTLTPDAPHVWENTAACMAGKAAQPKAISAALDMTSFLVPLAGYGGSDREGYSVLCELLRCVFGNPFRPATVSPAWQTPTVVALARAAYDERELPAGTLDPARLAVLADALEEAGCTDAAILGHLRSPGPHVRGCWALDAILGKT